MKSIFSLVFFLTLCLHISAQSLPPDLAISYKNNIPLHQEIISGGYYGEPPREIEGHPYFEFKSFENGKITINGITYKDVPLAYNIYTDDILTFQPIHNQKILIRHDKINDFDLIPSQVYSFVRIAENPGYIYHRNGIYQLLENGPAQLIAKHYKLTKPKREIGRFVGEYYINKDLFIRNGEKIFQIKKKRHAFEALGLDKKELKRILSEQEVRYHDSPEKFILFLVKTYNATKQ
jgi:hypothetical protein